MMRMINEEEKDNKIIKDSEAVSHGRYNNNKDSHVEENKKGKKQLRSLHMSLT
jgi:hypothetical protein